MNEYHLAIFDRPLNEQELLDLHQYIARFAVRNDLQVCILSDQKAYRLAHTLLFDGDCETGWEATYDEDEEPF